ncbi:MAG: nitrilase-related carbon-nitrogen hydrolase [Candidatus Cloacimonadaceae bacterium]
MYRTAVVQLKSELLQVDANLEKIEALCKGVSADLIVLPELVTSGYVFQTKAELETVCDTVPKGKSFQFIMKLAEQMNSSIVYGFPEQADGKIYNSAALVNPDGSYYIYRKTHLFYREKLFFSPSETGLFVCEAKGGVRIGMMICFDWQFPEAARVLALNGAQIICHPSNLVLPWCQQAMLTRSLENRVFSITANRIGSESNGEISMSFTGQSQITSTKGDILIRLSDDQEEVGIVEIEPELALDKSVTDMNDAFGDRRPAFYADIAKPK